MCSIQTRSSLQKSPSSARQPWLKSMGYDEFYALIRGRRSIRDTKNPGSTIGAGTDASAFHGRLGAQVALLQSPILPAVNSPYTKRINFRGLPVDKPHTRILRFQIRVSDRFNASRFNALTLCLSGTSSAVSNSDRFNASRFNDFPPAR